MSGKGEKGKGKLVDTTTPKKKREPPPYR